MRGRKGLQNWQVGEKGEETRGQWGGKLEREVQASGGEGLY